jgi:glycosyltransferase involved in cell wall biosynthesis
MKNTKTIANPQHHAWRAKVSVSLVTYNHADWIAQAIESVLNQKTDFYFEIIIGEDCSDDMTLEICKRYQKKHPYIIKILASDKNQGNRANSVRNLNACAGKYIAILSGDDFWNDETKLQQQVDFLDANENYSASYTQAHVEFHGHLDKRLLTHYAPEKTSYSHDDVASKAFMPAASSLLFRKDLLLPLPKWFSNIAYGDPALRGMLAKHGDLHCLPTKATTYRCNNWGAWQKLREQGSAYIKQARETIDLHLATYSTQPFTPNP